MASTVVKKINLKHKAHTPVHRSSKQLCLDSFLIAAGLTLLEREPIFLLPMSNGFRLDTYMY